MIAGELEGELANSGYREYDHFLGIKKKDSNEPKKTLGERLQNIGQKIDSAGGVEGIGRTIDNVRSFFKKPDPVQTPPSDYEIGIGQNTKPNVQAEADKKKESNLILIVALVAGGIIVIGGVIWWYTSSSRPSPVAVKNSL